MSVSAPKSGDKGILDTVKEKGNWLKEKIHQAPDLAVDYLYDKGIIYHPETRETVRKIARVVYGLALGTLAMVGFVNSWSVAGHVFIWFGPIHSLANPSPIGALTLAPTLIMGVGVPIAGSIYVLSGLLKKEHQRTAAKIAALLMIGTLLAGIGCLVGAGFQAGFTVAGLNHYLLAAFIILPASVLLVRRAITTCRKKRGEIHISKAEPTPPSTYLALPEPPSRSANFNKYSVDDL